MYARIVPCYPLAKTNVTTALNSHFDMICTHQPKVPKVPKHHFVYIGNERFARIVRCIHCYMVWLLCSNADCLYVCLCVQHTLNSELLKIVWPIKPNKCQNINFRTQNNECGQRVNTEMHFGHCYACSNCTPHDRYTLHIHTTFIDDFVLVLKPIIFV